MKAYLANALFSEADQMFNKYLAKQIRHELPFLDLYAPQENEALNDKTGYADSVQIFDGDNVYLDQADILIAVLDGPIIDEGVAAEISRFATLKEIEEDMDGYKPRYIYGLYTDVRQLGTDNHLKIEALQKDPVENQFTYRNLYVMGALKKHGIILPTSEKLINELRYNHG
jgi:hypothetical protein